MQGSATIAKVEIGPVPLVSALDMFAFGQTSDIGGWRPAGTLGFL